jgi:hypothetical protein
VTLRGWGSSNFGDVPVPADYDGDRKADIAVFRPLEGNWYIINSSNGSNVMRGVGGGDSKPVPADYDGDGKADVAVFKPSDNTWHIIKSSNNQFLVRSFGSNGDVPVGLP